ncbi:ketopantoate reductase family protein [Nakamurella sp. PAMC28650]|nr:ketopantoate reductase family protein [Nakamurella sp. PAMC28650]
MRILVVGAGATGGYFGGRLIEAGRDVTFLVRPGRAAQLAAGGLQIISGHGDLTLQPKLVTADAIDGHYHLILLSVKAYGLEQALLDIAPAVGKDTIILPLLNGLRHIDRLRDTFGEAEVLGGVCVVSATLDGAGRVVQLAGMQELTYGPLSGVIPRGASAVHAALQGAGFTAGLTENIVPAMWQKWIMLSSLGALNCLMRGTVGEIIGVPGGPAFAEQLLSETAGIAAAAGHPLRDAGQPVEVDAIIGDLVRLADRFGAPAPLLRLTMINLSVYRARPARSGH